MEIIKGAFVTKLLFEGNKGIVTGVEYTKDAETETIIVKEEVLMSAGPFGTPRLLQVSGIGDQKVLMDAGVSDVKADLPVGLETLVRPFGFVAATYTDPLLFPENNVSYWRTDETIQRFEEGDGGPLGVAFSKCPGQRWYDRLPRRQF